MKRIYCAVNCGKASGLILTIICVWGFSAAAAGNRADQIYGTYILIKANNMSLPAVITESPNMTQEVIGGSVILNHDKTFAWQTLYRYRENGVSRENESTGTGTYTIAGETITFELEGEDIHLPGTLKNGELRVWADVLMVYKHTDD